MNDSDQTQNQSPLDVGQAMARAMQKNHLNERYAAMQKAVFADDDVQKFLKDHQDELTQTIIDRDFASLYEFYTQKHKDDSESVHKGYVPSLMFNEGQINVMYQPSQATVRAQQQREQQALVHAVQMPKLIERAQLSDFSNPSPDQSNAIGAVADFITSYTEDPNTYHRGLYIHGPYGVGKTHLMGAMANTLARYSIPVTLVHFPSFAIELRNGISDKNNQNQKRLEALQRAQILVLDDIGAESLTAWLRDDILSPILEYRMQNELTTFFTSNFSMDQLEKEHFTNTKDGSEPIKAERLMQRIKFLAKEIAMFGENKRVH
ncbi:primosomal protein DnaI [Weissella uvarum]|uniref:primosomal protein DnaI n=1 Tax=Weissella uvarum TaxID=1479233 RepID=UPI001961AFC3|nr:primosomal protein DnaI [Weissella uvarum]MBM7617474.1 primosomal protein DnaI [Weissella uvarum]MCM0595641.1 primosomal protein DnaI [Weissella uvarum]